MYNDILRKVTSLSLLTILLTSTAVLALPNALPAAHAASNPNLFVSVENSQFNNYFAGPQVVQVVVSDPDINRLDQAYGEPTVTVNGKKLRMAQGTDGNWYAYFADSKQAQIADSTAAVKGKGLNFGEFCSATSAIGPTGVDFSETKGVAIAKNATGSVNGTQNPSATVTATCSNNNIGNAGNTPQFEHVVRENKTLTARSTNVNKIGQIGLNPEQWPVIQLYDFGGTSIPSTVIVDYQKSGGDQQVQLTFDRIPVNLVNTSLDRSTYTKNSQVFVTMNDPQLNVDPTEEDSWTWGANTTNSTLYYQAFDRNGNDDADGKVLSSSTGAPQPAMQNLIGNLTALMFNHNGKFTYNPAATGTQVTTFQSNGKEPLNSTSTCVTYHKNLGTGSGFCTKSIDQESSPVTFIESGGVNTGVFANWDGSKLANIITINDNSIRGQSATIRYNDVSQSIVGGFSFASISMSATNSTWPSGQRIPVTLTDSDANKNSKITEHLNLYDPKVQRLTTMKIGTPFTLGNLTGIGGTAGEKITFYNNTKLNPFSSVAFPGNYTLLVNATGLTTAPTLIRGTDNAQDIGFSGRPMVAPNGQVNFTNTGKGAIILDLNQTMRTLKNTIHNTNQTGNTESPAFKGFNFLNYDVRSLSTLTNVTGTSSISRVETFLLYDTRAAVLNPTTGALQNGVVAVALTNATTLQDFVNLNGTSDVASSTKAINNNLFRFSVPDSAHVGFMFRFTVATNPSAVRSNIYLATNNNLPIVADLFSIGIKGDGLTNDQRVNNGIYRFELEETGDNTGTFTGTNQYVMLNQLNIFDQNTYSQLRTVNHDVKFAAIQDMLQSEARAPQASYLDLGQDGVDTQVSAQTDIPTHTGVITFDSKTYKIADTVTITLNDQDLNVDNDLVDIYTAVAPTGTLSAIQGVTTDTIGKTLARSLENYTDGTAFGRLVDVQFGQQDIRWSDSNIRGQTHNTGQCGFVNGDNSNTGTANSFATNLAVTGFSLVETGPSTGIFSGNFEIPDQLCQDSKIVSAVGQNIKVNYVDFRDDSGKLVEVSDNAGIRGNTGSVKLDKAVYPVPFGTVASSGFTDFTAAPTKTSLNGVFPLHRDQTGQTGSNGGIISRNVLKAGDTIVHIRVNDRDYDTSAAGTDKIATTALAVGTHQVGPVAVQLSRAGSSMLLAYAGGPAALTGTIIPLNNTALPTTGDVDGQTAIKNARELGPMVEIAPDAGIFQADLPIRYTDGPTDNNCPSPAAYSATDGTTGTAVTDRFYKGPSSGHYCVRQGDVITVTYNDTNDASGHSQTVTDSSTFDLRNGVLQSDKSVYIIGSDMILTLVEPDFNLDSQTAETAPLDLIEWDSHAFKNTMGPLGGQSAAFDAKPNTFVETGKDTGIFQSVIKIPKQLNSNLLERGEQIHLEYTDWGPAGAKTVGANNQDIELTIYTSNFGATVELDQKVYTWTDRVYITVVAPDHNFDPNLIDIIGDNDENKVTVSTRGNSLTNYRLVETGVDTGIFTGYVILTGDPNIKGKDAGVDGTGLNPTGTTNSATAVGPTDGFLGSEEQDGVSVSFEFTRDQTVTGSALIRWNIGEIKWLEASYPANGQGVLQIVDPDMNLNPKAVDKFDTNVWSDSDSGGIKLTMTETGEATGIFQGTVYFTTNFQSSGNRLHVAEGDTVTGEYKDRTLPPPYTPADQLRLTATTFIGTIVPPLERAPASNPRIVDSFGNAITGSVKSGQQIQITADLTNGQDRDQPFAYLVQIQDQNGVTVSLSWITGTLSAGQSLNPAQSWTPSSAGTYTAQIFVWQSIDNPNALSPPLTTTINVA